MAKKNSLNFFLILIIITLLIAVASLVFVKQPKKITKIKKKEKAYQIAIVLDDWGYNINNIGILKDIKQPLTLAILPNLPYSRQIADFARRNKKEIMLHLPLEPEKKESLGLEEDTITTNLESSRVREIVEDALESIGSVRGVSNHMGSKATKNPKLMETIFRVLKKKDLYFLDSYTSKQSICWSVSRKLNVPLAVRSIFLDNKDNSEYILNQLNQLANYAKRYGHAIGIGHDNYLTLTIVKDFMQKLESQGAEFVYVSDLAY